MNSDSCIFVAGHQGLVGSALIRRLRSDGHQNLVVRTRQELDLLDQAAVRAFFAENRVEYVFLAAAKVGGILANARYPADFLYENLVLGTNIIRSAAQSSVVKLLYLGSSCIYPKLASQPIREESLLTGALEPTNEAYALAKIAILKLCEQYFRQYGRRFISAMPTNLYGPNDNFSPEDSHVIPGMMRRFHEAKVTGAPEVIVWGSGRPMREFLHVDDLASALVLLMQEYDSPETINVGTGKDCTIAELAETMKGVVGYSGRVQFDPSKPDGAPRKLLDINRITALGWKPEYTLKTGLQHAYQWAVQNKAF
ncbi:MAG TPA: GDP-L-fucose synthase [Candidatus Polarisedimenticolia bacterium]|jgi:GDP-L-fucose synthase|nr:GDP-L-fucose synthase [Candidatus Polarisedimenticolia bacterium]